jgi:hypothetical protein
VCDGIEYFLDRERQTAAFGQSRDEHLPVRKRDGSIVFYKWGVLGEAYFADDNLPGWGLKFPQTGWAPLASIKAGEWQKFEPRPVRIFASRFVCFDPTWETDRYFPLKQGEFVQGLLARINHSARVYVVTLPPPAEYAEFQRWPRVVALRSRSRKP